MRRTRRPGRCPSRDRATPGRLAARRAPGAHTASSPPVPARSRPRRRACPRKGSRRPPWEPVPRRRRDRPRCAPARRTPTGPRVRAAGSPSARGGLRPRSAGLKGSPAEDLAAFELVQAAPDPVGLTDLEREVETDIPNRADAAERLRLGLPPVLLVALLEVVRGEEQGGVLAAAGGIELPPLHPVRVHPLGHADRSSRSGPSIGVSYLNAGRIPPVAPLSG